VEFTAGSEYLSALLDILNRCSPMDGDPVLVLQPAGDVGGSGAWVNPQVCRKERSAADRGIE
jgi:hypothetical protein